jgi:hypothetical protein
VVGYVPESARSQPDAIVVAQKKSSDVSSVRFVDLRRLDSVKETAGKLIVVEELVGALRAVRVVAPA